MSDTGTQPVPGESYGRRPEAASGQLTVTIDKDVLDLGKDEEAISADKARSIIEQRLRAGGDGAAWGATAAGVATLIVQSLSDEAMRERVVQQIDLRPFLDQAQALDQQGYRLPGLDAYQMAELDRHQQGDGQNIPEAMLGYEQAQAQQVVRQANEDAGRPSDQGAGVITQYEPGVAGLTPQARADKASGALAAQAATPETAFDFLLDPNSPLFTQQQAKPTFPEDDYRQLVDMGLQSFVDVINAEQQYNSDNKTTGMQTSILYSPGGPDVPGSSQRGGRRLSLTSALDLPNTLGYEQVAELQWKLAMAGYFDQLGQGYREGDPDDEATQKAWENALADVYRLQKDEPQTGVVQFLARKAVTYRDEVAKRARDRFMPLDNDYVRASADAMATDLIGRRLNDTEYQKVRSSLMELRVQRADDVIGVDQMNWAADETARQYGFTGDEINKRIQKDFGAQAIQQDSWDAWQKVNEYFNVEDAAPEGDVNAN